MADEKIQLGDTVTLKSGGPVMTVESVDYDDSFWCSWFDGKQDKTRVFKTIALKKVDPEKYTLPR